MRSIFFRIYMGMLVAIIAISLLISVGTYYVSKYRITSHANQNFSGTFRLIGEGVSRHHGEIRAQWLAAIERLSNLEFKHHKTTDSLLTYSQLNQLKQHKFLYQVDRFLSSSQVFILLPDDEGYLSVKLNDFGSSLVRISAFLMLNEIGRHKNEERLAALEKLRAMFDYPIQLKTLESLNISTNIVRSVKKGDIAVVVTNSATRTPSLVAYAPLGNSPYALVLGSIPFFDWFPLYLIVIIIVSILVLMAAASFYLVRPLERRLKAVDQQIEQIGHDKELSVVMPTEADAIGKLSNTVNSMAGRIHKLIDAQNDMIRAISHELRTPITRIRFRMAAIEELELAEVMTPAAGIERDLNELETLVDEVLTFSKLKRDLPELKQEEVQVIELFAELKANANTTNQQVVIDVQAHADDIVCADRRFLFRAMENLLINALRYASNHIEMGCIVSPQRFQLWVADDGPGIEKDKREEIFEPFKRIDASRDRVSGGYGLGLAIVQQIAQWHKGKVYVEDSRYGGAKIVISWPRKLSGINDD